MVLGQLNDGKDDNLYSGFGTEEVAPALQTEDLEYDEGFQVTLGYYGGPHSFPLYFKRNT